MPWEQSARSAVSRAFRIVINCFTTQFYCQHRDIDASMLCVRRCAVCIARIYRFHFTPPCVCVSDLVIHYNYAFYGFRRLLFFVLLIFFFCICCFGFCLFVSASSRSFVCCEMNRSVDHVQCSYARIKCFCRVPLHAIRQCFCQRKQPICCAKKESKEQKTDLSDKHDW